MKPITKDTAKVRAKKRKEEQELGKEMMIEVDSLAAKAQPKSINGGYNHSKIATAQTKQNRGWGLRTPGTKKL